MIRSLLTSPLALGPQPSPAPSPSPPYGLRLCYWVEEPNCFSFVLQDSILSVGLQPPKPQLAAQSVCLEECEGLLMVPPSFSVLRKWFCFTLFHKHTRKQLLSHRKALQTEKDWTHTGQDSHLLCEQQIGQYCSWINNAPAANCPWWWDFAPF